MEESTHILIHSKETTIMLDTKGILEFFMLNPNTGFQSSEYGAKPTVCVLWGEHSQKQDEALFLQNRKKKTHLGWKLEKKYYLLK